MSTPIFDSMKVLRSVSAFVSVPAARENRPQPSRYRKPVGATMHHMAGYLPGTDRIFQNPATGYATNLGIGSDGRGNYEVHEYVPTEQVAWGNGNDDLNARSVSIEHENDRANGYASKPTPETHEISARVLARLAVENDWRINGRVQLVLGDWPGHDFYGKRVPGFGVDFNVITHRSVALKDCPNELDVAWIVNRANEIINGPAEVPVPEEDDDMPKFYRVTNEKGGLNGVPVMVRPDGFSLFESDYWLGRMLARYKADLETISQDDFADECNRLNIPFEKITEYAWRSSQGEKGLTAWSWAEEAATR